MFVLQMYSNMPGVGIAVRAGDPDATKANFEFIDDEGKVNEVGGCLSEIRQPTPTP